MATRQDPVEFDQAALYAEAKESFAQLEVDDYVYCLLGMSGLAVENELRKSNPSIEQLRVLVYLKSALALFLDSAVPELFAKALDRIYEGEEGDES